MHLGVRLSIGRLFGQKLTSELRPFFTSYLGHIVLAFTNVLLYVTGISFLQNHFVSLTLRPDGAYVFRPDTFLVFFFVKNDYLNMVRLNVRTWSDNFLEIVKYLFFPACLARQVYHIC